MGRVVSGGRMRGSRCIVVGGEIGEHKEMVGYVSSCKEGVQVWKLEGGSDPCGRTGTKDA